MQEENSCSGNIIYVDQAKGHGKYALTIQNLDVNTASAIILILEEYNKAKTKHPVWPKCIIKQSAIVLEEAGELIREANQIEEGIGLIENYKTEAMQTGAMALRVLVEMGGSDVKP